MNKSAKEVKFDPTKEDKKLREIPFVKPARIGALKIWRTKVSDGNKKQIKAIVVSNHDSTWKVQIPETYMMFRAITDLYSTGNQKDIEILFSFLSNFNLCTSISNGHFQNFLILVIYAYMHPEVLDDGYEPKDKQQLSYDEFMHRIKSCIEEYKTHVEEMKEEEKEKSGEN